MGAFMNRGERESLPEWKYGWPEKRLYPVTSQRDIFNAPARIREVQGERRELVKARMMRAALRQGFKLPKPWEQELANMTRGKETVNMSEATRETLRAVSEAVAEFGVEIFREAPTEAELLEAKRRVEREEIATARREAEAYADSINGRKRTAFGGDDEADARHAAEEFAEQFNRRHGSGARG